MERSGSCRCGILDEIASSDDVARSAAESPIFRVKTTKEVATAKPTGLKATVITPTQFRSGSNTDPLNHFEMSLFFSVTSSKTVLTAKSLTYFADITRYKYLI